MQQNKTPHPEEPPKAASRRTHHADAEDPEHRSLTLKDVETAALAAGLTPRGAFHPEASDGVPPCPSGPARTVVMLGNAGPAMWRAFSAACDTERELLDDWSKRVVGELAAALGGTAHFPFTRPHLPFQRWAMRAEPMRPSPLGILIHPDYGLWHGYRGALAFTERLEIPAPTVRTHPCDSCADKPCLSTCPVGAFSTDRGYDVPTCVAHIDTEAGRDCLDLGCRARRACPVGRAYRYEPAQAHFHMRAFLNARRKPSA
jgi:hypothetical protein